MRSSQQRGPSPAIALMPRGTQREISRQARSLKAYLLSKRATEENIASLVLRRLFRTQREAV